MHVTCMQSGVGLVQYMQAERDENMNSACMQHQDILVVHVINTSSGHTHASPYSGQIWLMPPTLVQDMNMQVQCHHLKSIMRSTH